MSEAEIPIVSTPREQPWFQVTLPTMFLVFFVLASSLAVFGAWGIAVFALVLGLAVFLRGVGCMSVVKYLVLAILCITCLIALLWPAVESAKEAGRRVWCSNNLKQIALALGSYEVAKGHYPPAYIADKNGKPMHSWRVLLLPYLDMDWLYKKYNFNEPWDGPNNKKLAVYQNAVYECPSDPISRRPGSTQTNYLAVVGANTAWLGKRGRKLDEIGGTRSDTVMVVEVANSRIAWMEPRDLSLDAREAADANESVLRPSSHHGPASDFFFIYEPLACANAAMLDRSVRFLPPGSLTPEHLPKSLQIDGCKQSDLDSIARSYEERRRPNWPNIAALAVWLISVAALLTHAVRSKTK